MNSKFIVSLVVVVLVLVGGLVLWRGNSSAPVSGDANNPAGATNPDQSEVMNSSEPSGNGNASMEEKKFTMAEVLAHDSRTSCYSVVRGSVYDLTSWIDKHPGGAGNILKICGKDGTEEFVDQHGGKQQQESALASFKIGVLAN